MSLSSFSKKSKATSGDKGNSAITPVIQLLKQNEVAKAEKEIAKIALNCCAKVENKKMVPGTVSRLFLNLMLAIEEKFPHAIIRQDTRYIIYQGVLYSEYGTKYGPDIDLIKRLANEILKNNKC